MNATSHPPVRRALPAAAAALLLAGTIGCCPVRHAAPDPARPAGTPCAGRASQAQGTRIEEKVPFSRETMQEAADNAARMPHDNTPRVVPFHKVPPPRENPNP